MINKLLVLFNIIIRESNLNSIKKYKIRINTINKTSLGYYNTIYNSIEYDYYNMSLIFGYSYNTIKIRHIKKEINSKYHIVCIFGILANEKGIEIANSMIEWLLPEYDIYCVYQKYPGKLFEFPALRFAQWLSLKLNITIILYIHTKGAFHQNDYQSRIRKLWKYEFTSPRKNIYIKLIENNLTDISLPFRIGRYTWFNGMFISYRAFKLINTIKYNKTNRWYYESLFKNHNIRLKGILNDNIRPDHIRYEQDKYLKTIEFNSIKKSHKIQIFVLIFSFYFFLIYIKILNIITFHLKNHFYLK